MFDADPKFRRRKSVIRMDPDCAICHAPATLNCDCEAQRLDVAIRQAEQRMMQSIYTDLRYGDSSAIVTLTWLGCAYSRSFLIRC